MFFPTSNRPDERPIFIPAAEERGTLKLNG